ncbi:HNH endonuclease signature motif containing protein [Kribbella antiqua]|nr:HNH endonuclease signature motif containing protein [Kribbella antiqua]
MELLGGRPVWSMSGSELLSGIDTLDAEIARLQTDRLHLVAQVDEIGYAEELGARDTVQLLEFRYRMNGSDARRDVRVARALPRYHGVSAALAEHDNLSDDSLGDDDGGLEADAALATADTTYTTYTADGDGDGEGVEGGMTRSTAWVLRPAQAEAIVSTLERFASRIPVEDRDIIEQELVGLAAHLSPQELRKAATESCELIDADGPEPDEAKASERESLKLSKADHGVKFNGFLANDNAELLRSLVDAGAKPRKTVTGEFDPRPRDKRQADALSAALSIAAAASDTGFPTRRPGTGSLAPTGTGPATSTGTDSAMPTGTGPARPASAAPTDGSSADRTCADNPSADHTSTDNVHTGDTSSATGFSDDMLFGAGRADSCTTAAEGDQAASGTVTDQTATRFADASATTGEAPLAAGAATGGWVPGFGAKANITVTIDFNDLKAAAANASGQLVYGDNLSASAVRRLACDANIIPLVLGSNSEPLDVGRSERLVNRAMRRALNARDKGCVVCGAPPIYCDAHHLTHWIDGGETRVDNLVLLCRRHHVDLHHGHWTITLTNGTVRVARPTWADPAPSHRLREYRRRLSVRTRQTDHPEPDSLLPAQPDRAERSDGVARLDSAARSDGAARSDAAARSVREAVGLSLGEAAGFDPWGDSVASETDGSDPGGGEQGSRSTWRADGDSIEEATRFAIWGNDSGASDASILDSQVAERLAGHAPACRGVP